MDRTRGTQILIRFIGDVNKGKEIQEALGPYGFKIDIVTEMGPAPFKYESNRPNIVILDGFPESETARSGYYQLQPFKDVLFLALNDSPSAIKFIRLNGLSFMKMIHRNPEPKDLVNAIYDLINQLEIGLTGIRKESTLQPKFVNYCDIQGKVCCC